MAGGLDVERLSLAFQARPDLVAGIQRAADSPARIALFNSITGFVYDQLHGGSGDEPALKRRKVDGTAAQEASTNGGLPTRPTTTTATGPAGRAAAAAAEPLLLTIQGISLSIPQRKKFDLCFTKNYLYARTPGTTAPLPAITHAWRDVEYVFYVPVPDKAQLQYTYLVFPRGTALAALDKTGGGTTPPDCEPLVFTVPAGAPKPGSVGGASAQLAASVSDSYSTLLHWALEGQLRSSGSRAQSITGTDAKVFHSAVRQAYRSSERAVHVRAFRGSKDGYLFFLPTGILWAFKKPLLFLPLDRIAAVSYTNVLQRTFNVVVEVDMAASGDNDGAPEEVEFGMLDQEDYSGIDETYVRRHGLQDRSMAEQRKAKRELAENGKRQGGGQDDNIIDDSAAHDPAANGTAATTGDGAEHDGLTELQRAEMQLQDEEDEMEEDYDPGSDGDSDGSGASSEDDDDEDDDDEEEEEEGEEEDE